MKAVNNSEYSFECSMGIVGPNWLYIIRSAPRCLHLAMAIAPDTEPFILPPQPSVPCTCLRRRARRVQCLKGRLRPPQHPGNRHNHYSGKNAERIERRMHYLVERDERLGKTGRTSGSGDRWGFFRMVDSMCALRMMERHSIGASSTRETSTCMACTVQLAMARKSRLRAKRVTVSDNHRRGSP